MIDQPTVEAADSEWVGLREAEEITGISRDALYQRIKTGRINSSDVRRIGEGDRAPFQILRAALATQVPDTPKPKRPYTRRTAENPTPTDQSDHTAFCAGYVTAWIELYARGAGVDSGKLVAGVAQVIGGNQ